MFRKKSVNLPNTKVFLPPAKAADILFRAAQHPSPFEFVLVDKPQDGTLFIFQTQTAGGQIPDDGYGWMDDEIPHKHMLENGMEVEMFARKQGFVQGDQLCTIQRCRYRLTGNPELNMLHYTKIPNPMTPVNQSLAKTKPRQQVSINQPVPPNYANPIMQMRMQPMTQQQQQLRMQQIQQMQQENLRKKQKLAQAKQVPQVRIIDEEPGFGGIAVDSR
ncbi:hypothetical protein EDD86DRAFT_209422 [Gorgonomyces haynaldii]|nr:hypothetical protein EDD86DRAFT_209422 [Gorgonomyces haynaldii]